MPRAETPSRSRKKGRKPIPGSLGDFIRQCRTVYLPSLYLKPVSQADFAALIDDTCTQTQVSDWELSETERPGDARLIRIAELCSVEPGELYGLAGLPGVPETFIKGVAASTESQQPADLRRITEVASTFPPRARRAVLRMMETMREYSAGLSAEQQQRALDVFEEQATKPSQSPREQRPKSSA